MLEADLPEAPRVYDLALRGPSQLAYGNGGQGVSVQTYSAPNPVPAPLPARAQYARTHLATDTLRGDDQPLV